MKRLRPTRNLLLLALGVSALVASFGIALAATVQVRLAGRSITTSTAEL